MNFCNALALSGVTIAPRAGSPVIKSVGQVMYESKVDNPADRSFSFLKASIKLTLNCCFEFAQYFNSVLDQCGLASRSPLSSSW